MNWLSWFEFVRVLTVFAVSFLVVPFLVTGSAREKSFSYRVAAGFVHASVFFLVAVMGLGAVRLALPGAVTAAYIVWAIGSIVWSHRHRLSGGRLGLRSTLLAVLMRAEHESPRPHTASRTFPWRLSLSGAFFGLLAVTTLFHRLDQPLHNFRFFHIETYSRVMSLATLLTAQPWKPDGATALLLPLSYWSGLGPGAVTRAAGPLFAFLLLVAVAFCAYRISRKTSAAFLAFGLSAIAPLILRDAHPGELSSTALAAVFWLLAAAFYWDSRKLALAAVASALLIDWHPSWVLLSAFVCALMGVAAARVGKVLRPLPALRSVLGGGLASAFILILCMGFHAPVAEGPFQYEAAARNAYEIARSAPRNTWLIVSPSHELAYTCQRGWHVELVDFVSTFTTDQVTKAEFSFPYPVQDVYFFVEKKPIQSESMVPAGADLAGSLEPVVRAYHTVSGRQAIAFQTARLLAAYGRTHADLATVYEDDCLSVYRTDGAHPNNDSHAQMRQARLTDKASATR